MLYSHPLCHITLIAANYLIMYFPALSQEHRQTINGNTEKLVSNINPADLLNELFGRLVLTRREVVEIKAHKTSANQNESLLNYILKKADWCYATFISALRVTEQDHLADILEQPPPPGLSKIVFQVL